MANDLQEQLTHYLTDAHSIEEQALQQLEEAPGIAGAPEFAEALRTHAEETRTHEARVRALLEARGASPSELKDLVMKVGGEGFVLFARSQTDTPGKLASHALSYEALEWASYDLLSRTAERAGEEDVARVARDIREEEARMMERIEGLFDRTVEASLREVVSDDLDAHLDRYLADAHALEAQSIQLLEDGRDRMDQGVLRDLLDQHLEESRRQRDLIEDRLEARGADRSILKDAAMKIGALEWSMFFRLHPDTVGKLIAFAFAFEHLEIGGYEQLRRVAERAGDTETARMASTILEEERATADRLRGVFDEAVTSALVATVEA